MHLPHGRHLAYCTNIHRGESWEETWSALRTHTLAVRDRLAPSGPFAIGLRLSAEAARELALPERLEEFRRWLDRERCYVFTINGFPYGRFHGTRVKEAVYTPDWTTPERLDYTLTLFRLLAAIVPPGVAGSVSTVPVSFKAFERTTADLDRARRHLWAAVEGIAELSERSGRDLHLGLEPEPLCTLETTTEALEFFAALRADRPGDDRLDRHLGLNYDCCHLAVEFEEAADGLDRLLAAGVKLSKIHLSNALVVRPVPEICARLRDFADDTYLHQVVERRPEGTLTHHRDLPDLLDRSERHTPPAGTEWRIHFHVPLNHPGEPGLDTTSTHVLATLDWLQAHPGTAEHLEMETYTWGVLPPELRTRDVVDQLAAEYAWTLGQLRARALA